MPTLQVRDLPQETYDRLAERARQQHRSLTQETIAILDGVLCRMSSVQAGDGAGPDEEGGEKVPSPLPQPSWVELRRVDTPEERARRRRASIERVRALPGFSVPADFPAVPELLDEDRERR